MRSLWSDSEAAAFPGDLGQRVYSSRLLGRDRSLVLHGGGNTSVKTRARDLLGEEEEILHVKGSGWDLETIAAAGFTPLRLAPLRRLAALERLSDPEMVNALLCERTRADAPAPSVETLLHAALPFKYVDHTHADAVVTVTNSAGGERRVREIYGDAVVVLPYVMPGFDLARLGAGAFAREAGPGTLGMVLLQHGIFSFGATARESYERMIHLVGLAEEHLAAHHAWVLDPGPAGATGSGTAPGSDASVAGGTDTRTAGRSGLPPPAGAEAGPSGGSPAPAWDPLAVARLRREISAAAGRPLVLTSRRDARSMAFARRADLDRLTQQGPATPDHVLRTKRLPLLGRDVAAYAAAYRGYFEQQSAAAPAPRVMLDPAPRVVLDPDLGLLAAGRSAAEAAIAAEIYQHTMDVLARADRLGGYRALSARELFAVEYWDLEQAKLRQGGAPPPLAGEVALVTGAASGIGRAAADALLARGAAVVGVDVDPRIAELGRRPGALGVRCDVTVEDEVAAALAAAVEAFGGVDALVLNAGIFPPSRPIAETPLAEWRRVLAVNLDANLILMRRSHPLLALAPGKGRVVVVGSKNVAAPGRGAAAYSASKAALQQLARVAALEWSRDGIRVNLVHPNAVFDTALWSEETLAARAAAYGQTVEQYRRSNLLGVEVGSRDVAEVIAELCGPRFSRTTGAGIPVDGGVERVI
jgi:rhamnose utilization protein RhaD (predicted bifunctional aldolase and dehydrogenase)/NAD(P)-dependent dehydrogenase (short-subunit alcohol dehydrogenase family)